MWVRYQHHHQLFDCGNGDFCGGESHQHAEKAPEAVEEAPAEPSEEVLLLREIRDSLKK